MCSSAFLSCSNSDFDQGSWSLLAQMNGVEKWKYPYQGMTVTLMTATTPVGSENGLVVQFEEPNMHQLFDPTSKGYSMSGVIVGVSITSNEIKVLATPKDIKSNEIIFLDEINFSKEAIEILKKLKKKTNHPAMECLRTLKAGKITNYKIDNKKYKKI